MNLQSTSAVLLVLGFVFILTASFVGPPGLYQEADTTKQLELIDNHAMGWAVSNLFFALAGVTTAVGLTLFSLHLRGSLNIWLISISSIVYSLGTVAFAIFLYRRAIDPAQLFTNYTFSSLTVVLVSFTVMGILLYGIVFLQAGFPSWLGLVTIAGMLLIGGTALFFPQQFFKSFPPQLFYLFTLIAGIVIWCWRQ